MTQTLARQLADTAQRLACISDSPRLDAELLMAHALGISRPQLLARLGEVLEAPAYESFVERRLAHEPIAYILSEWEFFSIPLHIEKPILVPRPETEHLVETVLGEIADSHSRILELCTGSGCIAVAVAQNAPQCSVTATDINPAAIDLARRNALRHRLLDRVVFYQGDLFDALPKEDSDPFDVICANPPYVEESAWSSLAPDIREYEDPGALLAGPEGLDVIIRIARGALLRLRPEGLLALEIGMGQNSAVQAMLAELGYTGIRAVQDLAGIDRIVAAHAPAIATER